MKLGYVLLYVEDVAQTIEFYEAAFGLTRKFLNVEGDQGYGELTTGETTLGFVSHPLASSHGFDYVKTQPDGLPAAFELGLVTDDVKSAYDNAVAHGATEVAAPTQKPGGQTVSYVRDNNGFLVEICSPVGG